MIAPIIVISLAVVALQSADPRPQDATAAVLAAFDRYDIVGMNAAHNNERQDAFILSLVRQPAFAQRVNDIVVECGKNSYQRVLDRYVAGEAVPIEDARQVWRSTSIRMCALSGFYQDFFPAIRAVNAGLPPERRLRVLLTEPPVSTSSADRDPSITSVVTTEVLAKHRKALLLCGVGHLLHDETRGTAVTAYETAYPGRTFVIGTHQGFAAFFDLDRGRELEARMRSWPAPSLVTLKGTWLADLDLPYFQWPFAKRMAGQSYAHLVDAYLYLGPGQSLTYERTPDSILEDGEYVAELSRRVGPVDVAGLRQRNQLRALFTADDIAEARRFAPGAEYVGVYEPRAGDDTAAIEIDFQKGVLAGRQARTDAWTPLVQTGDPSRFTLSTPGGTLTLEFEDRGGSARQLTVGGGPSGPRVTLVRR